MVVAAADIKNHSYFIIIFLSVYYTHNSGLIEKWVTRFLDTLTNQIPVNGQISK